MAKHQKCWIGGSKSKHSCWLLVQAVRHRIFAIASPKFKLRRGCDSFKNPDERSGGDFATRCQCFLYIGRRNTKNVKVPTFSLSYHQRRSRIDDGCIPFSCTAANPSQWRGLRFASVLTQMSTMAKGWSVATMGFLAKDGLRKTTISRSANGRDIIHLASVPSGAVPRPQ